MPVVLPVQNGLKQGDAFRLSFSTFFRICYEEGPRNSGRFGIGWYISYHFLFNIQVPKT